MPTNQAIRAAAKERGVYLWRVADAYGLSDSSFSRRLRHELPADEQQKILEIIHKLTKEA